jgi:CRP/FNR family transcriptional regulator, LitR-dependent transcriptional activator
MMSQEHRSIHYKSGQTIAFAGEEATGLFRLERGLIRITRLTRQGVSLTIRHVLPGDYFGEEQFTAHRFRSETTAFADATVRCLNPDTLPPHDERALNASLAAQLARAMNRSDHLRGRTLRQRIVWYLLELSSTSLGEVDPEGRTRVRVTHQLLGEGVGANRESVSKIIKDLRNEGLLRTRYRRLVLLDLGTLEHICHDTARETESGSHSWMRAAHAPQFVIPSDSGGQTLPRVHWSATSARRRSEANP